MAGDVDDIALVHTTSGTVMLVWVSNRLGVGEYAFDTAMNVITAQAEDIKTFIVLDADNDGDIDAFCKCTRCASLRARMCVCFCKITQLIYCQWTS